MQRRWSRRLKKAAIVLAVAGAALFLFSRKGPEVEPIQKQQRAAQTQAEGRRRPSGRAFMPRDIIPDRPERIPEKDGNGFVSWIKKTFDAKSLDCETRQPTAGKGDNLDMLMDEAGVGPFNDDLSDTFEKFDKLKKFYGDGKTLDFLKVMEKGNDLGSLIGAINHLDIYYSDRLSQKLICSVLTPKNCVVIADTGCYNHRNLAGNMYHAAIKSLARLALRQPEMSGRIIASLENGKSQEFFFESVMKETLEPDFMSMTDDRKKERYLKGLVKRNLGQDFMPVALEDVRTLETFARNLYPGASALFYRQVSESFIDLDEKNRFLFIRDNTADMQLSGAIDKALEKDEKAIERLRKEMDEYDKERKGPSP